MNTPVYIITGFLESGKTKFISEMLADEGFSEGERTLLLCCEEGEEEYDSKLLHRTNTVLEPLDEPEDLEKLVELDWKEFEQAQDDAAADLWLQVLKVPDEPQPDGGLAGEGMLPSRMIRFIR